MSALLMLRALLVLWGLGYVALFGYLWLLARREVEPLAARRSWQWGGMAVLPHFVAALLPAPWLPLLGVPLLLLPLVAIGAWRFTRGASPSEPAIAVANDAATARYDGRDIIFVRAKLVQDTPRYNEYYASRPELREKDDAFRALPGLMHPKSAFYEPYSYSAARATFETIYFGLYYYVDHHRFSRNVRPDPKAVTVFLQQWGRVLGADSVGVSRLLPEHLYTHGGYGDEYGVPTNNNHTYAISVTVAMDPKYTRMAPRPAEFLEVGKQYLAAATIATTLAGTIRQLGYSARAHVLDNHQVIQPLLARDAGLGEIGRMSILMSPAHGPRIRIGTVTTDLPLVPSERVSNPGIIDACLGCTKCAEACPAQAIPMGPPNVTEGAVRWSIDQEACFSYWRRTGVPCGRCLAVCPYSLPDAPPHRVLKASLSSGGAWRNAALRWHDHFYGVKPKPLPAPDWLNVPEAAPDDDRAFTPDSDDHLPTVRVPGPEGTNRPVDFH